MFDPLKDIREFHEKFGLEYKGPPRVLPSDMEEFRTKFMKEEAFEYEDVTTINPAHRTPQMLEEQFDAIVDLVYVALGTAYLHGFDFAEGWRRVHEANMKKVRVSRTIDSKRGSQYDVVKPDGWKAPVLLDLVTSP